MKAAEIAPVEDMVQGVSVIRNPAIARVFLEMGLIEKWGTGLPRAIETLTDAGLPAPELSVTLENRAVSSVNFGPPVCGV